MLISLPEPQILDAWDASDQTWRTGEVKDADNAAVDLTDATLRALIKEHATDDDADAVAEFTATAVGDNTANIDLALAADAGLEGETTYHWSVLVTFPAGHASYPNQTTTVAYGELRCHYQATQAQAS